MRWSAQQSNVGLKRKLKKLVLVQNMPCSEHFESLAGVRDLAITYKLVQLDREDR